MTDEQTERYYRQILLKEIGLVGQQRLLAAKVLVIGAGGLGSPAALYLAAAGVGRLGIVDFDTVDRTNLQRQILHTTDDIGRPKVQSAVERVTAVRHGRRDRRRLWRYRNTPGHGSGQVHRRGW